MLVSGIFHVDRLSRGGFVDHRHLASDLPSRCATGKGLQEHDSSTLVLLGLAYHLVGFAALYEYVQ